MAIETPSPPGRRIFGWVLLAILLWAGGTLWQQALIDRGPVGNGAEPVRESVAEPVGEESYAALLSRAAGMDLEASELISAAESWSRELEAAMTAAAGELVSGEESAVRGDWRTAFQALATEHAPGAEGVLESYRREIERARIALTELDLVPMPAADVTVEEIRNPIFRRYFSLAMYLDGRLGVTVRPVDDGDDPESYLRNHCGICIPPLAVHEVYPGHHVAYSRAAEAIADPGKRTIANRKQVTYHEGWALYAEQLMLEQGYYETPERRLGALRTLYLRALRAWIDPRLHGGEMDRGEAEKRYVEDGLMTPEAARSEVDRHLKDPVLKATYFVGLRQILDLRRQWRAAHPEAPLKEFHRLFLGEPRPIPTVAKEMGYPLERPI